MGDYFWISVTFEIFKSCVIGVDLPQLIHQSEKTDVVLKIFMDASWHGNTKLLGLV